MVNWWPGRRGRGISAIKLLGRKYSVGRNHDPYDQTDTADFANQHGIYLLHKGLETVYVGQTTNDRNGLFQRLRMHCVEPGRGPLWDTFSWFGFKTVDPERRLSSVPTGRDEQTVPVQTLIKVVETIVIQACLPRLNGQAGQISATHTCRCATKNSLKRKTDKTAVSKGTGRYEHRLEFHREANWPPQLQRHPAIITHLAETAVPGTHWP